MTCKGGSPTSMINFGAREHTLPLNSPLGLVKCRKTVSEKLPELSILVIFRLLKATNALGWLIKLVDQLVCIGVNFGTMFAYHYYYMNERQTPLGEGVRDSKNIFLSKIARIWVLIWGRGCNPLLNWIILRCLGWCLPRSFGGISWVFS